MSWAPNKVRDLPDSPKETRSGGVRVRILVPLTVTLLVLLGGYALRILWLAEHQVEKRCAGDLDAIPGAFERELNQETEVMVAALEAIAGDDHLRAAFVSGDANALLNRVGPLFARLRQRSGITHFYFLGPDRVCFLRVHQPQRRGDRIDRFTARQAEKTGRLAHGIEIGLLGTFTLRVVRPWFEDGRLIGYIELGEEIEHITRHLRETFEVEVCVAIHKKFLDQARWQEGMAMLGREADWDRFPDSVMVTRTMENMPDELCPYLAKGRHSYEEGALAISLAGGDYRACFWELTDAGGREVGDMIILRDVTTTYAAFRRTIVAGLLICLSVGAGLFGFFYVFLGRVDRDLTRHSSALSATNEKLHAEVARRRRSEQEMRAARNHLSSVVEAIPDPFLVIDRNYRIVLANNAVRTLAGGVDPVAENLRCHQVSHHSDTPCEGTDDPCPLLEVVATKQPVRVTHTHYTAEGEPRVVEIVASPILDAGGEVVEIIEACRDITERRRAEEELKATVRDLDRFNRAAVNRETRMIELKREVNEMARKAGVAPPYDLAFAESSNGGTDDEA